MTMIKLTKIESLLFTKMAKVIAKIPNTININVIIFTAKTPTSVGKPANIKPNTEMISPAI